MALTVDEIAEIIKDMRAENENNAQGVERVLAGINNKLDLIAEDDGTADLIRVYISELKKSVDEKHNITVEKFNEIENFFNNNIASAKEELAKTSELKDLFNSLALNMTDFSNRISAQRPVLEQIDSKLSRLDENTLDKDEISTLIGEISLDLSGVSSDIENSFRNVEDKLSDVASAINGIDNATQLKDIKERIEGVSHEISALPSSISHFQSIFDSLKDFISGLSSQASEELNSGVEKLENSFQNIVTGTDFKGFKQDLADFVQKIIDNSSALNSQLTYSTDRIENILTTVKSLDFRDDFENVVNRLDNLKNAFEDGSRLNYSNLSQEITGLSQNLNRSFENLDEKRREAYSSLKSSLDDVLDNISVLLNNSNEVKLDEISGSIASISHDILSLRSGISSDFQDDYGDLKAGLNDVISAMQLLKDEIVSKSENSFDLSNQSIEYLKARVEEQVNEISSLKDLISESNSKEPLDISGSLDKVVENLSEILSEAKDNANSNYEALRDYVEEISQNVNELQSNFNELARQNAEQIISNITNVTSTVETFRDEFKQSAMTDLENSSKILDSVGNVSLKIDNVEQTLSGNARVNFESLKSILDSLSEKITDDLQRQQDVFVQSNYVGEQQKLETIKNLSDDIKACENKISSDIETFKYNVQENISGVRDFINEINSSISTVQSESEAKLSAKLESIEVLSHSFDVSVSSVQDEIRNVLEKINSLDFSQQSSEIKLELSNIVSTSNFILSSINEISTKNSELMSLFSNISEIVASKDYAEKILDKLDVLEKQDYSYDLAQLSSKMDDMLSLYETSSNSNFTGLCEKIDLINSNLSSNEKSDLVLDKLDNFYGLISDLRSFVENNSQGNKNQILEKLVELEEVFSKIVTAEDFSNFRKEFSEFVQKLLDSASVLHISTEAGREQIAAVLEKLETLNYFSDFENIAGRIDEIRASFENNSKMNYENLVAEINNVKVLLSKSLDDNSLLTGEKIDGINASLSEITSNIQALSDLYSNSSFDTIQKVSDNLHLMKDELGNKLEDSIRISANDIKVSVVDILNQINTVKEEFVQKNDSNTFNTSLGFDGIKSALGNLSEALESFKNEFQDLHSGNLQALLTNLDSVSGTVDELKNELHKLTESYLERIYDSMNSVSVKLDAVSEGVSGDFADGINSLNEMFSQFSNDVRMFHEESMQEIKDDNLAQVSELKNISGNIENLKEYFNNAIDSLKVYVSELDQTSNEMKVSGDNKVTEKLLDLESSLANVSEDYEQKMETLQGKLSEFVQIVENSTSDTEAKIASSLEEITDVKAELSILSNTLKSAKINADEKFSESLSLIDTGIENIINNIKSLDNSVGQSFSSVVQGALQPIDEKFSDLLNVVNSIKEEHSSSNGEHLVDDIEEKISSLKEEIGLVNTDIADALQSKTEDIIRAFEPIKINIEDLLSFDFGTITSELKTQLEASFTGLSLDVNGELTSTSEAVVKLEQAYKETFEKVSTIEECVNDKLQSDLELLNITFEKGLRTAQNSLEEKYDEHLNDLKAHIEVLLNNLNGNNSIDRISSKLDKLDDVQSAIQEQGNVLSDLDITFKSYMQTIDEKFSDNDALQSIESKFGSGLKIINDQLSEFSKTETKVSEMLSVLHEKVDVLALSTNESDILEEIDDIKDLIFEQRKYFEATSDEKAAAIDKYLRDLLLKLDNLDLEKNSEDVKTTIMNALVSLFDQISFVEETEDIKDFVEEKTDEIKQNLIQVQTQLHQIASSNDDFDYSYTLQDVESDIAKLRLAMNQISAGADFEGLSEGIKQVVNAVEGLESSLTQDQIVDLKSDIEKLNEDILSISSRTNKLILTSDESYKVLNDGLNNFSSLIYRLEDRINELDKTQLSERLERKLDNLQSMAISSANADKVFHQVMMYLGEWIDSTTENISSITDKTAEISNIKEGLDELKGLVPEQSAFLNSLQLRFEKQEERISELESKLDKILSTLEEKDDMVLNRKVDKIEKMLSRLGISIEKLTSYVDEE